MSLIVFVFMLYSLIIKMNVAFIRHKTNRFSKLSFSIANIIAMQSNISPIVVLEKGKARLFQEGNPLVYGGAIKELKGNPSAGSFVTVTDHFGNEIGKGIYNPNSTYRVRMFSRFFEKEYEYDFTTLLEYRVKHALLLRKSLSLPSSSNTAYRAINGEGDRLGGLVVDIFNNVAVIQSSALWVEHYRTDIEMALKNVLGHTEYIYLWKQSDVRLRQDGYEIPKSMNKINTTNTAANETNIVILENDVKYIVNPDDGQKTGFYCDQRSNRLLIKSFCQNKTVLDTYCYSGGFSMNAALGGATKVTAVDSSQTALDNALENIKLNNLQEKNIIDLVKQDAIDYMRSLQTSNHTFDIVICDPPKLAPTRSSLPRALSKYIKINTLGLSLVKPGGLFLTCSCSAAVTQQKELPNILQEAARIARRDVTVLSVTNAAPDHTVHLSYPEGQYLTAMLVCVH